jgi:hypothetical protein
MRKNFVVPGLVVGKLTVLREIDNYSIPDHVLLSYRNQGIMYECDCECGQKAYWPEKYLANETVKSCGCLSIARRRAATLGKDTKEQVKKIRRRIRNLQLEQARARFDGTLDKRDDLAQALRSEFERLNKLGYAK